MSLTLMQKIPIGTARVKCTNVLFNPLLVGKDVPTLLETMQICVNASGDPERRLYLWENIALSGGLAGLQGAFSILLKQ